MTDEAETDCVTVAAYLDEMAEDLGLSDKELAGRLGYNSPNIIRLFREGKVKVPLDKIPDLANAIGADREKLMERALREYLPETIQALIICLSGLTENELAIVDYVRKISGGSVPSILNDERMQTQLREAFSPRATGQAKH